MTRLGLACEDNGHYFAITRLVDDVLVQRHDYLRDVVEHCRTWCGHADGERWSKCSGDDDGLRSFEIDGTRVKLHGKIDGEPLAAGANMWRRLLARFARLDPRPEVVVLAQDMDGQQRERLRGLDQVRRSPSIRWPFEIVVAAPEPEIEAWHVAGFEPASEAEQAMLDHVSADLSFDPRIDSHRLTSHPNDAATDAKRVLDRLCGLDHDRRAACLVDHDRIRGRGALNGVADFLAEVDAHIVPLFGGSRMHDRS